MKIGILTFVNEINYGCSLQGYALQRVISTLDEDIECSIIDYSRNRMKDSIYWLARKIGYKILKKDDYPSWTIKEYLDIVKDIGKTQVQSGEAIRKFHAFWQLSDRTSKIKRKDLSRLSEEFDFFVVGSDQVWNCGRLNLDKTFLLDFEKDDYKKGSYAASLGITQIPKKYCNDYYFWLGKFHYLSCREKSGKTVIQNLLHREVNCHVDPTFLLKKGEWLDLVSDVEGVNEKYVLLFVLEESEILRKFAKNISEQTNIPIVYVNSDLTCSKGMSVGPKEFVKLINDAECVITNSFHGIAMSINLNTNFYAEICQTDYMKSVSSRIYDLFELFDIDRNHMFSAGDTKRKYDKIDYSVVEEKLNLERDKSFSYLRNMIDGVKSEK